MSLNILNLAKYFSFVQFQLQTLFQQSGPLNIIIKINNFLLKSQQITGKTAKHFESPSQKDFTQLEVF